jgi:HlyD family secretion protein
MSFICSLPVIASLLTGCVDGAALAVGYVEGDYVMAAPVEAARVQEVLVGRGDVVRAGQPLAVMERRDAEIALSRAEAALSEAEATLADLKLGRRPEEIAVLEAERDVASAEAAEAVRELQRASALSSRGIAAEADVERLATARDRAQARLAQADAHLAVARLPARDEAIEAARMRRDQAAAAREEAAWRLEERTINAPEAGRIDDVLRMAGDTAGPAAPVISLLPQGRVRLKLYVPEPALSSVPVGTVLAVACDGCSGGLRAEVTYVAPEPEFTPPVIYSIERRQKLVHLIEARPLDKAASLSPGQIVDVRLSQAPSS